MNEWNEDQKDEVGSFCTNSNVWLALKLFLKPTSCANPELYSSAACRGCGYFEIREPTDYAKRRLQALYPGTEDIHNL